MIRIYNQIGFGNYLFIVNMNTEEKNKNELTIHNQSLGKTIYNNNEIWDSDLTKIIRTLKKYEYSRLDINEIIKKLEKGCRHLKI